MYLPTTQLPKEEECIVIDWPLPDKPRNQNVYMVTTPSDPEHPNLQGLPADAVFVKKLSTEEWGRIQKEAQERDQSLIPYRITVPGPKHQKPSPLPPISRRRVLAPTNA